MTQEEHDVLRELVDSLKAGERDDEFLIKWVERFLRKFEEKKLRQREYRERFAKDR